ncbi:dipeptide ABC transporter ATP-binding protein [Agrobacterium vitis]|uniref:ABC transporter ATP-binding protein n=1 Tax=Rhizobium/Agrobacterium group TaxID=227290 RepID=UPI0008DC246B|nr:MULTISPECIES: dipeptide ABC transporter ATP-binding protein [Rhizobium/Agrobacterium group]MCF1432940.1 dipeptide ABC transporter ATP-binding protein [Allorhizobium ampelinum]MUO89710.1 dipeptide ABC transporter ATP-binding protein [Agrobacterium vitis]MUZ51348.1 dipeptide ABC transporter ATP-binding protein [Agrobacterium vitis]MUZ92502.1 dipeptide ABC transporter ATP-binding protein [Agrobacterium vitis]MVA38271.1 dipeptide ABC transporter ATP-binding protein [Agrobacterium vitis]
MSETSHTTPLLSTQDLTKSFTVGKTMRPGSGKLLRAVEGISLDVYPTETLGLVGESGSGKSTLGRCLTRLYDVSGGSLTFDGQDITKVDGKTLKSVRRKMQMIFQDPSASLNPRRKVRDVLSEVLKVHKIREGAAIEDRLAELMDLVGLRREYLDRYPHEFSGGQRQRIGIARALAVEPKMIVADEPVSALDVSVQAQIVNLFSDLREKLDLTYVFIAHDLAVVRQVSTRVAVMYLGSIVEIGDTDALYANPSHPYTQALLSAIPQPHKRDKRERILLTGEIPSPLNPPGGCKFSTRCPYAKDICRDLRPPLTPVSAERKVACHFPLD